MTEQTRRRAEPRGPEGEAAAGCPAGMGTLFDPFGAHAVDPFPFYAQARSQEPVFYSPTLGMWVVAGHDEIVDVMRDPDSYSSRESVPIMRTADEAADIPDLAPGRL